MATLFFLSIALLQLSSAEIVMMPKSRSAKKVCTDPAPAGSESICSKTLQFRYYYDSKSAICRLFVWGGCNASANSFENVRECHKTCMAGGAMSKMIEADKQYSFPIMRKKAPSKVVHESATIDGLFVTDRPLNATATFKKRCGQFFGPKLIFDEGSAAEVPKGSLPWVVKLISSNDGRNCTGSLVASRWVLTSAHCAKPSSNGLIDLAVFLAGGLLRHVTNVFHHPAYSLNPTSDYDIALLKLNEPVSSFSNVYPICLPDYCSPQEDINTNESSSCSKTLDELNVETLLPAYAGPTDCAVSYLARMTADKDLKDSKKCLLSEATSLTVSKLPTEKGETCRPGSKKDKISANAGMCLDLPNDCKDCDAGAPVMCRSESDQYVLTGMLSRHESVCKSKSVTEKTDQVYVQRICKISPWLRQMIVTIDYSDVLESQIKY